MLKKTIYSTSVRVTFIHSKAQTVRRYSSLSKSHSRLFCVEWGGRGAEDSGTKEATYPYMPQMATLLMEFEGWKSIWIYEKKNKTAAAEKNMWDGKTRQIFQFSKAAQAAAVCAVWWSRNVCMYNKKRRKDNLNQVIFHCVLSRIIFFILTRPRIYPLMEYYLPFSLFFRIHSHSVCVFFIYVSTFIGLVT